MTRVDHHAVRGRFEQRIASVRLRELYLLRVVAVMRVLLFGVISIVAGGRPDGVAAQSPADTVVVRTLTDAAEAVSRDFSRDGLDSAIVMLRRALALEPRNQRALDLMAWRFFHRGTRFGPVPAAYDSAVVYGERLSEVSPARGLYTLGRLYRTKMEYPLAEDAYLRAIAADSSYVAALVFLGYLYFEWGQHHRGVPVQRRALALDPQNATALNLYGFSYFHLERPDLAVQPFQRSTAVGRTSFTVGGELAIRLMRGDVKAAVAYTDSVWRTDSASAYTWSRLGEAHFMAGNFAEAERFLSGALRRDSASTNLYVTRSGALPLAFIYLKSGRATQAAQLIARSYARADLMMRIGQEPWNAYYQYANLALLQGDRDDALRWLRAAHEAGMPGPVLIRQDPVLAELRGDPEFQEIVDRLEWRVREMRKRLTVQ